jgi:hypothetical protein
MMEFHNPEIAAEVTQLFHSDFIHFQRPSWDGNAGTFRSVQTTPIFVEHHKSSLQAAASV